MTHKELVLDYLKRVFGRSWFLLTGLIEGISIFIDFATDKDFPRILYPYLLLGTTLLSTYLAYVSKVKEIMDEKKHLESEIDTLRERIEKNEGARPKLRFGILNDVVLSLNLPITLHENPPKPDINNLLEDERQKQLARPQNHEKEVRVDSIFDFNRNLPRLLQTNKNPNFESDVEEYLDKYAGYLLNRYNFRIRKDRLITFSPILENIGTRPANNVIIELTVDSPIRLLTDKEYRWRMLPDEYAEPRPPKEPSLFIKPFDGMMELSRYLPLDSSPLEPIAPGNTTGPEYEYLDDSSLITYEVSKLLQNRSADELFAFSLWFGDVLETGEYEIFIQIFCSELPEPITEILKFDIQIVGIDNTDGE